MAETEIDEGSFDSVGVESASPRAPGFLLSFILFLQVFPVVWFAVYGPSNSLTTVQLRYLLLLSALLFGGSLVTLAILRLSTGYTGPITVSWLDERGKGGPLRVTYHPSNGRNRDQLPVRKVSAHPNDQLLQPGLKGAGPSVPGMMATLRIEFEKPKMYINLGFPSAEEMNKIYEQLR